MLYVVPGEYGVCGSSELHVGLHGRYEKALRHGFVK